MSKKSDIALLLMVLVMLSASIGILHGRKKLVDQSVIADDAAQITLTQQDALDYLQPHFIAGNLDSAAATLHQFIDPLFLSTVQTIVDDSSSDLTDAQKIEFLAALLEYDKSQKYYHRIIPALAERFKDEPIFAYFLQSYSKVIPYIITWMQDNNQMNDLLQGWIEKSFEKLIKDNEPDLLKKLFGLTEIKPSVDAANKLLALAVQEKKSPVFINFLIDQFGADVSYSPDGKKNMLMLAVETNNEPMVKALLAKKASYSRVLDPAIGSARQIAFERGFTNLEQLFDNNK